MNNEIFDNLTQKIVSTLDALKSLSEQKQIDAIFSTFQAFHQLINNINSDIHPFFSPTLEAIKECIKSIQGLIYFCSNKENDDKLSPLLIEFISSDLFAPKLNTEFALLTNSYLYCNFSCSSCIPLLQFIVDFFSNQLFCSAFEKFSGLNSIFNILIDEKKSLLCHKVVNSILPNLKYYYTVNTKANEFLTKSIDILPMIPFTNSSATFKMLFQFTITHKPPVMSFFITEKFEIINNYILSDKEGNLLFIYSIFFDIMHYPEHSEFMNTLSIHLLNMINNSNSCPKVKKNALATFKVFLANFSENLPVDINLIYSICCHIKFDDIPSILIFLDIVKYISTHFKTNKIILASAIHPFVTKENALNSDISDAFEVMQNLESDFNKCASSFIVPLIKDSTPQELKTMLTKYPIFFTLYPLTIHDFPFNYNDFIALRLFLESDIYKVQLDQFGNSLIKMLKKELFFPYALPKLIDIGKFYLELLFNYAGKACRNDNKLKRNWHDNEILKTVNEFVSKELISSSVYFDFIASLTPIKFNEKFDKSIFDFLENNNYFNQTEESIKKLAFGRLQEESLDDSFLVLPSLLYKCGNFELKFPSDLFLSSKYSIDIWSDKINKSIDQFPSIEIISRRYIQPHHYNSIFHSIINEFEYENFLNCMPNELDYIPLIEFQRNVSDTFFSIALCGQHQASDTFSISISIWFYFPFKFECENQILTISDFSIYVNGQNLYILNKKNKQNESQKICKFKEKSWLNLIICYGINNGNNNENNNNNNELSIYKNSKLKFNEQNCAIPNGITFGSSNIKNNQTWYIGGYIRIINDNIGQSTISNIFNFGVFPPPLHLKNERPLILVTDINVPIDSNIRKAPSLSFLKILSNSLSQSNGFCGKILKLISNKNERNEKISKKLFYSMILNQSLIKSQKFLSSFTLNLSILANLKTNLFDSSEIFDLINKCFVKVKSVNWEPFFTFYMDLNFFEKDFVLEKVVEFIENYRSDFDSNKNKFKNSVFRFCFESICLSTKEINFKLISKLLTFFDQDIKNLCVYLSSLYKFFSLNKPNESNYEDENLHEIKKKNQDELCKYLIQEMNFKIITEFKDIFVLNLINNNDYALEFCYILLSIQPKMQRLIDKKKIMSFCLSNVNKIKAWDCAMTLLICSPITFETNYRIEYDTLDITIIPLFLIMLGALFSVAHNFEENSKWKKMTFTLISFIESIMENFGRNDQTTFSMIQLVYFNTFVDYEYLFPFAPGSKKIEEIANISVTRSQEFPNRNCSKYEESKLQLLIQKEKCNEYIDNVFNKTINMIPPYSSKEVEFDFSSFDDFTCNYEIKWNSFREFIHDSVRSFGFDDVKVDEDYLAKIKVSKVTTDVLDLLSKYLFLMLEESHEIPNEKEILNVNLNQSLSQNSLPSTQKKSLVSFSSNNSLLIQQNCEKEMKQDSLFLSYLKSFTLSLFRIHPSHALFVSQRIILSLLTECINQNVYSLELIDFACDRAREGWFANQVAPLISLVISICQISGQTNLPHSVYSLLILGFEITPFNQFPIFSEIYLTYQSLIFNDFSCRDPNFYLIFIEYVLKYNHVVPETFQRIWHLIYVNMTKYQLNLKEKWPNGTFDLNYKYVCLIEKQGFSFITDNKNDELFQNFYNERKRFITHFIEEQYYLVIQSMKNTLSYIYNQNSKFNIFIREILSVVQTNILTSKVIGDVICERMRQLTLFDFDLFYRIREMHITKNQNFEHCKGKGNSLIVLGNQLFPSKRVEKSVLFVNQSAEMMSQMIPKNINIDNDYYIINANETILDHFSFDFNPIQNILYSKEQIGILMFSQKLPILNSFLFKSFEVLYDSIEFTCDASFLYGIEPLNGTIIKNSHSLIFIEGLKIQKNEMKFISQQNISPFAFNFYMNYFSAGYFGPCSLFCGHPILKWNIDDIVNIIQKNKGKIENEFEYEFNFIYGWNFILKANLQEILGPLSNASLPFISHALSLLRKDVNSASEMWIKGMIDNFSYLCYLNMMSGRSYCTFANYPIFPQIYDDFEELKLRDLSKPFNQFNSEIEKRKNSVFENQIFNLSFVYSFFKKFDPFRFLLFVLLKKKKIASKSVCLFSLHKSLQPLTSFEEVVPHFYTVPELCKTFSLPSWCCIDSKMSDFVFRSQILLQSDEVTVGLSNWIDLFFGYLFNPSEKVGQQTIQLFKKPHEKRQILNANFLNGESAVTDENNMVDTDVNNGCGYNLSFDLFGLHIMTNPEKVVVQTLNAQMFRKPIYELFINNEDSSIISMKPLTVFITSTTFLSINPSQGCILKNANVLLATSYYFLNAVNLSISPDRLVCAVTGSEGLVSMWRIKYEGSNPVGCTIITSFQVRGEIDGEIFENISIQKLETATSKENNKFSNSSKSSHRESEKQNNINNINNIKESIKLPSENLSKTETDNDQQDKTLPIPPLTRSRSSTQTMQPSKFEKVRSLVRKLSSPSMAPSKSQIQPQKQDQENQANNEDEDQQDQTQSRIQFLNNPQKGRVIFSSHHFIAITAYNDQVVRFDLGRFRLVAPIKTGQIINCVAIDEMSGHIIACGDGCFTIWTISGGFVYSQDCGVRVRSVCVSKLPIYVSNRFFVTGHDDGFLLFWTFDAKVGIVQNLAQKKVTSSPITAISIDGSSMRVVASTIENEVFCLDFVGTERSPVARDFAFSCPNCHEKFDVAKNGGKSKVNAKVCSKCHRYFCGNCVTQLPRKLIQMVAATKEYICEFCASC